MRRIPVEAETSRSRSVNLLGCKSRAEAIKLAPWADHYYKTAYGYRAWDPMGRFVR
jgi:hypothetical protein